MAKQISYWDVNKEDYMFNIHFRFEMDNNLKNCKIINVETLEDRIRFWYYKED